MEFIPLLSWSHIGLRSKQECGWIEPIGSVLIVTVDCCWLWSLRECFVCFSRKSLSSPFAHTLQEKLVTLYNLYSTSRELVSPPSGTWCTLSIWFPLVCKYFFLTLFLLLCVLLPQNLKPMWSQGKVGKMNSNWGTFQKTGDDPSSSKLPKSPHRGLGTCDNKVSHITWSGIWSLLYSIFHVGIDTYFTRPYADSSLWLKLF